MDLTPAARANLVKLMLLARAESDALRSDLADVEAARAAAEASLANLAAQHTRHTEKPDRDVSGVDELFRARRHGLLVTIQTLERAAAAAREKLAASFAETRKLEALIAFETGAPCLKQPQPAAAGGEIAAKAPKRA